jgi:glucose-6-phosphate isomerase
MDPELAKDRQWASLGRYQAAVDAALAEMQADDFVERLWRKDHALWKPDPTEITNRLGWLTSPAQMRDALGRLTALADDVRSAGFTHVLLLGMGGSSLGPEVLRATFGIAPGYPDLAVLDTTDPATILAFERQLDLARTLFIVSSKSGGTVEVSSFYKYFRAKVEGIKGQDAGENFIAITDPGTSLEQLAREAGFRALFLNPDDIGGRYSVLSYFGLVPAALIGMDVKTLLDRALEMAQACGPAVQPHDNPGVWLGAVLGELARPVPGFGPVRDKVTFLVSPGIDTFGYWVEQIIAESTGKEGKGILPVEGEPPGPPGIYGNDRLFVYLRLERGPERIEGPFDAVARQWAEADLPVVRVPLRDAYDLGCEFFRWEVATVVAGARLGIHPFDQPNVQESKDNTRRLLSVYTASGRLPEAESVPVGSDSLRQILGDVFANVRPGDYIAILAYIQRTSSTQTLLGDIRTLLQDRLHVATTVGYGPRFLHSTGQLHKGGPPNGVFIQLTADDVEDVPIPSEPYTFGVLKAAQALGDWQSLRSRGRRALWLHLGTDVVEGLERIAQALE